MAEYKDITPFIRDLTAMKQAYDAIGLDGMIRALNDAPRRRCCACCQV